MFDDWYDTAGVRGSSRRLFSEEREEGLALFSAAEVPELSHPLVAERGTPIRDFLLTQKLYQYLLFTVHLETRVVNRALERIGNGRLGMSVRDLIRLDAYKIYTDEAYHALSNLDLLRQVATATGILPGEYRFDPVISALDGPGAALPDGLGQLLQAVVFETMVTSILDVLPRDTTVATVVRTVVADHADDERRHHAYFALLFPEIWQQLDIHLRAQAASYLPGVVRTCLKPDLGYAHQALRVAGLQPTEADRILTETY
jgi:P-aminobenzoate N-oxygenase AurF